MHREEFHKLRRMFIVGLIFSAVTVIGGEMPVGWVVYPEADMTVLDEAVISVLRGFASLSMSQLACGVFFGAIGIPLQYFGYEALAEIVDKGGSKKCGRFIHIGAKAIAFWGAVVHVMSIALMFICKTESSNLETLPQSVMDFTLYLVLPITALFMAVYLPMTVAMMIPVVTKKTIFPRWAIIFNPIFVMILINAAALFAPNTELMNGIRMSHMGLGSLYTFLGLILLFERFRKKKRRRKVKFKSHSHSAENNNNEN